MKRPTGGAVPMGADALMDFEVQLVVKAGVVEPTANEAATNGQLYYATPDASLDGSIVVPNVINGKKYWARYRARDGYNGYSSWSAWAAIVAGDTTGPGAPNVYIWHNYDRAQDRDDTAGQSENPG